MGPLIGSIEGLQIILHICLTDVTVPGNAQLMFMEIFKLVSFDPIDIQDKVEKFFELDPSRQIEMEGNFVHLGYDSTYMISSMGSLVIINAIQVCYIMLLLSLLTCEKTKYWFRKKLSKVFFDKYLAFF